MALSAISGQISVQANAISFQVKRKSEIQRSMVLITFCEQE